MRRRDGEILMKLSIVNCVPIDISMYTGGALADGCAWLEATSQFACAFIGFFFLMGG